MILEISDNDIEDDDCWLVCVLGWFDYLFIAVDVGVVDVLNIPNASVFCAGVSRGSEEDDRSLVTSGGRVLTVVVTACDVGTAAEQAQLAAQAVNFTGKIYRTDIALKALKPRFGVDIVALLWLQSVFAELCVLSQFLLSYSTLS